MKIVGVEHPFIIQNIQKGIETLGGQNSIEKVSPVFNFPSRYEVRREMTVSYRLWPLVAKMLQSDFIFARRIA